MSRARRWFVVLSFATFVTALFAQLTPPGSVEAAFENCGDSGENLTVDIVQVDRDGELLAFPGARVVLTPDPDSGIGDEQLTDNSNRDASNAVGRLRWTDVCNTTAGSTYTVALVALPLGLECEVVDGDEDGIVVADGASVTVELEVRDCKKFNLLIRKEATPDTGQSFLFSINGTRPGCDGTYLIHDDQTIALNCRLQAIYAITEHETSSWRLGGIECVTTGSGAADRRPEDLRVWVGVSQPVDTVFCVFRNVPAPPTPELIQILAPNNVGSQTLSHVNVVVRTGTGAPVPDGTRVDITTTLGYVTPAVAFTRGGAVLVAFVSPPGIGSALITARTENIFGQANIRVGPCDESLPGRLRCVSASCPDVPGGTANVTFTWDTVPGAIIQWLDISLVDNGFRPGTFLGAGPLPSGQKSLTWSGILPGFTHYWRVNSLMPDGTWRPSETGVFVPCLN
jgi:hypothetical protein